MVDGQLHCLARASRPVRKGVEDMKAGVIWSGDESANELMGIIGSTLQQVQREGFAYCKLCGLKVYGDDIGEILEMLGEHGDADHKEKI